MTTKSFQRPEILAPCGSPESVTAAIYAGADAVYMGQSAFHARQNAANFTLQTFSEAVNTCHLYGVKVYETLNTLVFDSEIESLKEAIRLGCEAGVDAFIVQDMGTLSLVQQTAPDMPIHASTQMTIHTPAGARFLESLGVKRAVLARELSLDEIRAIHTASGIELEVFVQGALCVSVSGQCYISGMLGGRSGNRGKCAQPCRLPFSVLGDGATDLSLKDLSAIEMLDELTAAGVCSFKIEGRMKRPEYVAAAVNACLQKQRGETPDLETLQAVFSRSGFTNAYLLGQRDRTMFGARRKEDVVAAADVLKPLQQLYRKSPARVACVGELYIEAGRPVTYRMTDQDGNVADATGEPPEQARTVSLTIERAEEYLSKLGGTPFYLQTLNGCVAEGLTVSAKALNALRRDCVATLTAIRTKPRRVRYAALNVSLTSVKQQPSRLRIRVELAAQLAAVDTTRLDCIIPIDRVLATDLSLPKDTLIAELPRVYFGQEESLKQQLLQLKAFGISRVMIQNPAQITLCKPLGFTMLGGFGLNVTNSYAVDFYRRMGLQEVTVSFETNLSELRRMVRSIPLNGIVYGHLPLMITRSCPFSRYHNCVACDKQGSLTDRQGKTFRVTCHDGIREMFNPDLLYLADRLSDFETLDFLTLYFTDQSADEIERVVGEYSNRNGKRDKLTRGLYYRNV